MAAVDAGGHHDRPSNVQRDQIPLELPKCGQQTKTGNISVNTSKAINMETYKYDMEIIVPGSDPEDYIEFQLELTGAACMCEADGGEMREATIVHEIEFECMPLKPLSESDNEHIRKWITANGDAINEMFAEKYRDFDNFYD